MITVHHLSTSRSERVIWLMEELGLDYVLERHERERSGAAPPAMKALHALGKAPVIVDGELVLAESGAIVEYIVRRHGGGRLQVEPHAPGFARYLHWIHFAEGSLMAHMLIALVLARVPEAAESRVRARILEHMEKLLAYVDAELEGRDWIAGSEFTAADVMMVFPFTTMRKFLDYDLVPYANIAAYLRRIEARPAYAKAMALAAS